MSDHCPKSRLDPLCDPLWAIVAICLFSPLLIAGEGSFIESKIFSVGYKDEVAKGSLTVTRANGKTTVKAFDLKILEATSKAGEKQLIHFTSPESIKGLTLLSHSHFEKPADQWIYLPAFKSSKKVSGASQAGKFAGSDFSFEDLKPFKLVDYTLKFIQEEPCGEKLCNLYEAKPTIESQYSLKKLWVEKGEGAVRKIDFFDKKGAFVKSCTFDSYHLYKEKFLRPNKIIMTNVKTNSNSTLAFSQRKFGTGVSKLGLEPSNLSAK